MQAQKDINATMRSILIDWLVEVAEEYRLVPETLYLAVNYIDRFLSHVPVNRSKLTADVHSATGHAAVRLLVQAVYRAALSLSLC